MGQLDGIRIVVVGINYWPESTGIAPYTTALARALAEEGASVHVITGLPHYPQWSVTDPQYARGSYFAEEDGAVRVTRCRHWVPEHPDLLGRLRMEVSFLMRALRVVARDRSDVVLTVTPSLAGIAAAVLGRRGRPVGAIVQDLTANAAGQTGAARSSVASALRKVEYGLLRRCKKVGVITPEFGRELQDAGVAPTAIVDLPNFTHIEPREMSVLEARAQLGWDPTRFTVLHTGNMGAKQGLLAVVDAAKLAAERDVDVDFVLMGDGNQRQGLASAAAGVDRLLIRPPLSGDLYPVALAAADVLLVSELPGVVQMSLPSKLTSYAAAGKPIVAMVDAEGITARFLADVKLGEVLSAGASADLLATIISLKNDPTQLAALAAASTRVFHSHYDKAVAYGRYVDFAITTGDLIPATVVTTTPNSGAKLPIPRSESDSLTSRTSSRH